MNAYVRYYAEETPYSQIGHAMFVDAADAESVETAYGPCRYEMIVDADAKHVVQAGDDQFVALVAEMIKDREIEIMDMGFDLDELLADLSVWLNPVDIVDSADLWDSDDIVPMIWEIVMEPNGWTVVETHDGAIAYESETQEIKKVA